MKTHSPASHTTRLSASPRKRFGTFFVGLFLMLANAHALFLDSAVTAVRVANNSIVVDGRPDPVWKQIAGYKTASTIRFNDYPKIVLLQPDSVRNADPAKYFKAPSTGSVSMLAAYDDNNLYFYFVVKANTLYHSTACSQNVEWKGDAPEVYVDPSPWDPSNYQNDFSIDGSGLAFGTSPLTVNAARPAYAKDSRPLFYRDRTQQDSFKVRITLPTGVQSATATRTASDTLTVGVEMKIPFWTAASNFSAGRSLFISWGYNYYPDSLWANCNGNPIAYRWAKNYLNYDKAVTKPPGWRAKDSTHYDPTRSWDGWGRFDLNPETVRNPCVAGMDTTQWDITYWAQNCNQSPVTGLAPARGNSAVTSLPGAEAAGRDALGREVRPGLRVPALPWSPAQPDRSDR